MTGILSPLALCTSFATPHTRRAMGTHVPIMTLSHAGRSSARVLPGNHAVWRMRTSKKAAAAPAAHAHTAESWLCCSRAARPRRSSLRSLEALISKPKHSPAGAGFRGSHGEGQVWARRQGGEV